MTLDPGFVQVAQLPDPAIRGPALPPLWRGRIGVRRYACGGRARGRHEERHGRGGGVRVRALGTAWIRQARLLASDAAAGYDSAPPSWFPGIPPWSARPTRATRRGRVVRLRPLRATWTEQRKLTSADPCQPVRRFRVGLRRHGGGRRARDRGGGAAYVFVRTGTTWTQQASSSAPTETIRTLRPSVSVSGDTISWARGGRRRRPRQVPSTSSCARVPWTEQARLLASERRRPPASVGFVSVSGDTAVVGALGAVSAYVFVCSGRRGRSSRSSLPRSWGGMIWASPSRFLGTRWSSAPLGRIRGGGRRLCVCAFGDELGGAAEAHRLGWGVYDSSEPRYRFSGIVRGRLPRASAPRERCTCSPGPGRPGPSRRNSRRPLPT